MAQRASQSLQEKDQMELEFSNHLKQIEEEFNSKYREQARQHKEANALRIQEHAENVKSMNFEREKMRGQMAAQF